MSSSSLLLLPLKHLFPPTHTPLKILFAYTYYLFCRPFSVFSCHLPTLLFASPTPVLFLLRSFLLILLFPIPLFLLLVLLVLLYSSLPFFSSSCISSSPLASLHYPFFLIIPLPPSSLPVIAPPLRFPLPPLSPHRSRVFSAFGA